MAARRSEFQTLFELLSELHVGKARRGTGVRYVTTGRTPKPFPQREGVYVVEPDEILSIRVPRQRIVEGSIVGYQRGLTVQKAHAVAREIEANPETYMDELTLPDVSLDAGMAFATDGQHTLAGAAIANMPMKVVAIKRSPSLQKARFTSQAKATRINRNVLILDAVGVIEEYIQDAVTDPKHPWNELISVASTGGASHTTKKISATSAYVMLQNYAMGLRSNHVAQTTDVDKRFDSKAADDLARLLRAFGDRRINPYAFSGTGLRAIARAGLSIMRENPTFKAEDLTRWETHMPKFPFVKYQYLRSHLEIAEQMVNWWNRGLSGRRRVSFD